MPFVRSRTVVCIAFLCASCTHNLQLIPAAPRAAVTTTAGPWSSMIFAARTDSGVLVIDLGWAGASKRMRQVLAQIGATPADVRWAFITHAHRDHIGGWTSVAQATFVLGRDEVPLFTGTSGYRGLVPRVADYVNEYRRPTASEVAVLAVQRDTVFAFGHDTLRAYAVPGHTPGSMAYLFRETLFVGDAAHWNVLMGFRGAPWIYSDDLAQSRTSMRSLIARLDASRVRWQAVCTAHGKCAVADSTLRRKLAR